MGALSERLLARAANCEAAERGYVLEDITVVSYVALATLLREAAAALADRDAHVGYPGSSSADVSISGQQQAEARVSALERERDAAQAWAREQSMEEREQRARAEKAERELEEARAERQRYVCELALQDDELARLREQLAAAQARLTRWLSDGCTDTDIEVPLDDYGKEVLKAALSALPGADPTKVER